MEGESVSSGGLDFGSEVPQTTAPNEPASSSDRPREVPQPDSVPDQYDFGEEDAESYAQVGDVAREFGLSQEKARRFFDAVDAAETQSFEKQTASWLAEAKRDPELGRDFDGATKAAQATMLRYAKNEEFLRAMAESGITNHPEFIRMMYRISRDVPPEAPVRSHFPNSNMQR